MDKRLKKRITFLKQVEPRRLDKQFHEAHDNAFACIDCLECANCCTTTGPLLTDRDINRIAKHLGLKEAEFAERYLRVDEENDQVFKSMPCPFLGPDNYCSIYDVRPKACKEYPHTDRVKQYQLLDLHLKNQAICPAVDAILKELIKAL